MSGGLGDPKIQKKAERAEQAEQREVVADMRAVMSSPAGRRFVHRLIFDVGNILDVPIDRSLKDGVCAALHTWASLGRQEVARELLEQFQAHCPEFWDAMLRERLDRQQADRSRLEKLNASAEVDDHGK